MSSDSQLTTSPTTSRSNMFSHSGPTKKALLIGIEYWNDPTAGVTKIDSAHTDVDTWFDIITRRYGYHPDDVVCLRDIAGAGASTWPTYDNITEQLELLATDVQPGDKRFLFFACHGVQLEARSDKQELDGKDEGIMTRELNNELLTLKDNLIRHILVEKIPSGASLTAVADTCHSGTLLDLPWEVKFDSSGQPISAAALVSPLDLPGNIISISACKDEQECQQLRGRGTKPGGIGILTYQFNNLMGTAQPNIKIPDLVARLTLLLKKATRPQHPVITCGNRNNANLVFDP